jgi:hypothetical protein
LVLGAWCLVLVLVLVLVLGEGIVFVLLVFFRG